MPLILFSGAIIGVDDARVDLAIFTLCLCFSDQLVYKHTAVIDDTLAALSRSAPTLDIEAQDGVRHELWVVDGGATIDRLSAAFEQLDGLYVADGHHRSAAAARVAAARKAVNPNHPGDASYNYFLSASPWTHAVFPGTISCVCRLKSHWLMASDTLRSGRSGRGANLRAGS